MATLDKLKTMQHKEDHELEFQKAQVKNDIIHLFGRFELVDVSKVGAHLVFKSRGSKKGFTFRYHPLTIPELIEIVEMLESDIGTEIVQEYAQLLYKLQDKIH